MNKQDAFQELEQLNKTENYNGVYAVVSGSKVLFQNMAGYANPITKEPFTEHTSLGLGSVTKQFTATSILKLKEEGRVDIDALLSKYVPEYKFADQVTLRQMLNMDSGIPDYTAILIPQLMEVEKAAGSSPDRININLNRAVGEDISFDQIIELINGQGLDFEPGSKFTYCNTNYALLSHIVEKVSGESFAEFVKRTIFNPLDMNDSSVGTKTSDADSFVFIDGQYESFGRGNHFAGDGSVVLSLNDFEKWAQAIINQTLLTPESVAESFDIQHDGSYGMGWMKSDDWYWHSGHIVGFWSDIYLSPDRKIATIFLHNVTSTDLKPEMHWMDSIKQWHTNYLKVLTD